MNKLSKLDECKDEANSKEEYEIEYDLTNLMVQLDKLVEL